jgi:putative phosphoesterase
MRIAVLSDIHDNVWKLDGALESIQHTDALICLGDLCSPFVIHQMGRGYTKPTHIIFGNNDADLFRITANARKYPHITLHGEFLRTEFDGKKLAANHFDYIALAIAASGEFEVVCYGHNHQYDIRRVGRTLAINPGAIMGATFGAEAIRTDVFSTFLIYDTQAGEATGFHVAAKGTIKL